MNSFLVVSKLRGRQSGRASERGENGNGIIRRGRHLGAASRANPRTGLCSALWHVNTSVNPFDNQPNKEIDEGN